MVINHVLNGYKIISSGFLIHIHFQFNIKGYIFQESREVLVTIRSYCTIIFKPLHFNCILKYLSHCTISKLNVTGKYFIYCIYVYILYI